MTGVVDVGGGLRGIYGSGVFDRCMDDNIYFDYCIGVSAGSANIATFLGKQKGRNYTFFTDYMLRKKALSLGNFLFRHSYIDLDYIYGTLTVTGGENPHDYETFCASKSAMKIVATDPETGEAHYFDKTDITKNNYAVLKASSAIPVVCAPYTVYGKAYIDGGVSDPVPVKKAFADGCDRIVLILTKPADELITLGKSDKWIAKILQHKYPRAAEQLLLHAEKYNEGVALAKEYERKGKALIVSPSDCCGIKTLTKDKEKLIALYKKGYEDGGVIKEYIQKGR